MKMVVNFLHDVDPGEKTPEIVNVVIEIPMGSSNKYELDNERGVLCLDRVMYSPFYYPTDYGFIPRTWCEDEDPLDAMVLSYHAVVPLCIVESKPVGVLKMKDEKGIDEKILCVPTGDPKFNKVEDINDLPEHWFKEITHFFEHYKELEESKFSEAFGWLGSKEAKESIKKAIELYNKKFNR